MSRRPGCPEARLQPASAPLSGVKGPKKMFPDMPFGNMDSEKIEARKGLLEAFLKVGGAAAPWRCLRSGAASV